MLFIPIDVVRRGGHFALGRFTQFYCLRHFFFLFLCEFSKLPFIVWRDRVYFTLAALRGQSKLRSAVTCLSSGDQFQSFQATVCAMYSPIFPPPRQKLYVPSMFDFSQTMTLPEKQSGACPSENSWASELELREIRRYASQISSNHTGRLASGTSSTEPGRGVARLRDCWHSIAMVTSNDRRR
jgi:hypothetical protein